MTGTAAVGSFGCDPCDEWPVNGTFVYFDRIFQRRREAVAKKRADTLVVVTDLIAEELGREYPRLDVGTLKERWAAIDPGDLLALSDALHDLCPESA